MPITIAKRCIHCRQYLTDVAEKLGKNQCADCYSHTIMGRRSIKEYNKWLKEGQTEHKGAKK